ncbi:hypothetical protein [Paenibacillus sp. RC343]|uniref:hypothetical protein n=1 Tax=Paenibacillus sp. RC343 TaxID=3045841 RepID=UPI0024BB843F|nr:hypothetical protein [Paenibacillus sp. RC343]
MRKPKEKSMFILTLLLSLAMLLSACAGSNNQTDNANGNKPDGGNTSSPANQKEVVLKGYLLGEAPKGMPEVLAALNKKLKKGHQYHH